MSTAQIVALPRKPPNPAGFMKLVRELAAAGALGFHPDAFGHGNEMDIHDARLSLQIGELEGDILPGNLAGEWRCSVIDRAGARSAGVRIEAIVTGDRQIYLLSAKRGER